MKLCDEQIYTCRYSYLKFHYEPVDKDRIMKAVLFAAIDARSRFSIGVEEEEEEEGEEECDDEQEILWNGNKGFGFCSFSGVLESK